MSHENVGPRAVECYVFILLVSASQSNEELPNVDHPDGPEVLART